MLRLWVLHKIIGVCLVVLGMTLLVMATAEVLTRWIVMHVIRAFVNMASHVFHP